MNEQTRHNFQYGTQYGIQYGQTLLNSRLMNSSQLVVFRPENKPFKPKNEQNKSFENPGYAAETHQRTRCRSDSN
jgi:hypothetical protein